MIFTTNACNQIRLDLERESEYCAFEMPVCWIFFLVYPENQLPHPICYGYN